MPPPKVPSAVKDFVRRYLRTVEELEVFMLLQRTPAKSWSAPEIADELRIQESTASQVLERLASLNFLDIKISNDILYRFNPAKSDLAEAAARAGDYYLRERITMTSEVMSAAFEPLRDFAEAFRIKKDQGDG